jgi:hypothetical protein
MEIGRYFTEDPVVAGKESMWKIEVTGEKLQPNQYE